MQDGFSGNSEGDGFVDNPGVIELGGGSEQNNDSAFKVVVIHDSATSKWERWWDRDGVN